MPISQYLGQHSALASYLKALPPLQSGGAPRGVPQAEPGHQAPALLPRSQAPPGNASRRLCLLSGRRSREGSAPGGAWAPGFGSRSVVIAPQRVVNASQRVINGSQSVVITSRSVVIASQSVVIASQSVVIASRRVVIASRRVVIGSQSVANASRSVVIASQSVVIGSQSVVKGI